MRKYIPDWITLFTLYLRKHVRAVIVSHVGKSMLSRYNSIAFVSLNRSQSRLVSITHNFARARYRERDD